MHYFTCTGFKKKKANWHKINVFFFGCVELHGLACSFSSIRGLTGKVFEQRHSFGLLGVVVCALYQMYSAVHKLDGRTSLFICSLKQHKQIVFYVINSIFSLRTYFYVWGNRYSSTFLQHQYIEWYSPPLPSPPSMRMLMLSYFDCLSAVGTYQTKFDYLT